MAEVTDGSNPGPIPEGQKCDDCSNRATHRVLVAHDSFGNEYADLCDTHYAEHCHRREERRKAGLGTCCFCKKRPATTTISDPDEPHGEATPICKPCDDTHWQQREEEADAMARYFY